MDSGEGVLLEFYDPQFSLYGNVTKCQGFWIPTNYADVISRGRIRDLKTRDDDIFVITFPKSGTHWTAEITHQLLQLDTKNKTQENDVTVVDKRTPETADADSKRSVKKRYPNLDYLSITGGDSGVDELQLYSSPRIILDHIPYSMLPTTVHNGCTKVIYCARNPKDVVTSFYHFAKNYKYASYTGSLSDMVQQFLNGEVNFGPWDEHIVSYWEHRDDSNIIFIYYEDLKQNPESTIKKMANFLSVDVTDEQCKTIIQNTSFQNMKRDPSINRDTDLKARKIWKSNEISFMRKGEMGDWKNHLSEEMANQIDQMCNRIIVPSGIKFIDHQ